MTASVGSRRHTCPTKRRVLPMIIEPIIPKDHCIVAHNYRRPVRCKGRGIRLGCKTTYPKNAQLTRKFPNKVPFFYYLGCCTPIPPSGFAPERGANLLNYILSFDYKNAVTSSHLNNLNCLKYCWISSFGYGLVAMQVG